MKKAFLYNLEFLSTISFFPSSSLDFVINQTRVEQKVTKMESRYEYMNGVEEIRSPKMMVDEHVMKEFQYQNGGFDKSDSFVVDMENVTCGLDNETTSSLSRASSNPRFTRNLSKKAPQRGNDSSLSSPRVLTTSDAQGISTPKKSLPPITTPKGFQDTSVNHQLPQHQSTIKTSSVNTTPEGRWGRRSSFKRSPTSWFAQPKRILLVFATLSCMGTMLLIYFTLSTSKRTEKEGVLDWQ